MHKEIRNTLAYIVVATFVMITAVWQAQVSAKRDLEARHRALPPPPKTKRAVRSVPQTFAGDPVADYIARSEKGMTDREIGWIIEDFKSAGLDSPPGASPVQDYLNYRQTQHRWYRDALVDALQLTPEQTAQVSAKLAELYPPAEKSYMKIIDALKPITGSDGKQYLIAGADTFNSVISARDWIESSDAAFHPGKLGSLTPQQEAITRKVKLESSPQTNEPPAYVPNEFHPLDSILPLSKQVDLGGPRDSSSYYKALVTILRSLHPAQLKLFLLFNPTLAAGIEAALDSESH